MDESKNSSENGSGEKKPGFFSKISWGKMAIALLIGIVVVWILCSLGSALSIYFGKDGFIPRTANLALNIVEGSYEECTRQTDCNLIGVINVPPDQDHPENPLLPNDLWQDECTKNSNGCNFSPAPTGEPGQFDDKNGYCIQKDPTREPGKINWGGCFTSPLFLVAEVLGGLYVFLQLVCLIGSAFGSKKTFTSEDIKLIIKLSGESQRNVINNVKKENEALDAKDKSDAAKRPGSEGKDNRTSEEIILSRATNTNVAIHNTLLNTSNATQQQIQSSIQENTRIINDNLALAKLEVEIDPIKTEAQKQEEIRILEEETAKKIEALKK